jgi:hypothetical protein
MSLIKELKKNRGNFLEKLKTEIDKLKVGNSATQQTDERLWQPTKDKVGNAVAVIRFLPPALEEEIPWARVYSHGFQNKNTGSWYIENCPTTIGQKCPLCEANTILWNTGLEKNKNVVRDRKRRLSYMSNILVISDPAMPENEGKVKLFRYGKKIFDKINSAMCPEFADMKPVNPFDPWEGANFKLRVRKYEGFTNYDKSEFSEPAVIGDDDMIENLLKQTYPLAEFAEVKKFKSYDELKARLNKVLAEDVAVRENVEADDEDVAEEVAEDENFSKFMGFKANEQPKPQAAVVTASAATPVANKKPITQEAGDSEDESEIENYLKKLAADDD